MTALKTIETPHEVKRYRDQEKIYTGLLSKTNRRIRTHDNSIIRKSKKAPCCLCRTGEKGGRNLIVVDEDGRGGGGYRYKVYLRTKVKKAVAVK